VRRLLVTISVVPSSLILVTLMKEALSSFETSVLTRATPRNIPEDAVLHSHRRENLKSCTISLPICKIIFWNLLNLHKHKQNILSAQQLQACGHPSLGNQNHL
jgi:hypothetical protein